MSFWSRNGWVLVVATLALVSYFHFSKEKKEILLNLHHRLEMMEKKKLQALQDKEDLEIRLASQHDPAWIEMVLIRELGVVPEGFLKVHFGR